MLVRNSPLCSTAFITSADAIIYAIFCSFFTAAATPRPRSSTTSSTLAPESSAPRDSLGHPALEPDRRLQWGVDQNATRVVSTASGASPPSVAGPVRPQAPWPAQIGPSSTTSPAGIPAMPPRRWFPTAFPPPPRPPRPPVLKTYDVPIADGKKSSKKTPGKLIYLQVGCLMFSQCQML